MGVSASILTHEEFSGGVDLPQTAIAEAIEEVNQRLLKTLPLLFSYPINDLFDNVMPADGIAYDLNNEIHPIFARSNFPVEDYEVLEPALHLATLLISTPCLLHYWHAMLCKQVKELERDDVPGKKYLALFRKSTPLTSDEIARTQKRLVKLAKYVKFQPASLDDDAGEDQCTGRTESSKRIRCWGHFWGHRSIISYCEKYHARLRSMHTEWQDSGEEMSLPLLKAYFELAQTLTHELAHASRIAAYGASAVIAFENLIASEEGFDWAHCVFGGVAQVMNGVHMLEEWPSAAIVDEYVRHRLKMFWLANSQPQMTTNWRIPPAYIRQLFRAQWWQNVVPEKGAEALLVPRLLGSLCKPETCDCEACLRVRKVLEGGMMCALEPQMLAQEGPPYPADCKGHSWPMMKGPNLAGSVADGYACLEDGTLVLAKDADRVASWANDLREWVSLSAQSGN